jgi:ribonucleoside-diphosphate reductase alpha chain
MQYDTTINRWHTSKNTARINASNPCSEYMFLDDSACNLASLNLLKFAPNGTFDVPAYRHAIAVMITAQEILVDNSGYPTEAIAKNSHDYRPLGLGYANLGALLMAAACPTTPTPAATTPPASPPSCAAKPICSRRRSPKHAARPRRATPLTASVDNREDPGRLPRLVRQPRTLPRRHPHASRRR